MSTPADQIVVNTSPLLALDACNQIDVLRSLYARVIVPEEVDKELRPGGKTRTLLPGGLTVAHRAWIEVLPLSSPPKASLTASLDPGEAAVIALALELGASQVLIDERKGWREASLEGLTPVGSVGIILLAKRKGLIMEVKPHLYEMRNKGIYLGQRVIDNAIVQAGETP
jgi:predicted nucleic acid-binding protein